MNRLPTLGIVLLSSLLGACSILPEREQLSVYRLPASALPPHSEATPAFPWALRVTKPQSSQVLDSVRIAVLPETDRISAYAGTRWADRAPQLLRDRLIDGFRDDGRIVAVSSDDARLQADLDLSGDLRAFQSEYRDGRPEAHIQLEARLVQNGSQRILASRRFVVRQAARDTHVDAVVKAFGLAGDQLARQVVDWTLDEGRRHAQQR